MRQIATESMRKYINTYMQEKGYCPFSVTMNGEKYCHFLNPYYCPFDFMEKIETEIFSIPQRKFYRCLGRYKNENRKMDNDRKGVEKDRIE